MKFEIPEISEIKVVTVDNHSQPFAYIDQLTDGSWRIVYTKGMNIDIKERKDD
jgi:hypothetical protein